MLIKDLPIEIQNRIEECQREQKRSFNYKRDMQDGYDIFTWSRTSEGEDFWEKINDGDFTEFYERYPKTVSIEDVKSIEEDLFNWLKS